MEDVKAYCDEKELQLGVLQGQVEGVSGKLTRATSDTKRDVEKLLERWSEAQTLAYMKLAEIRQRGDAELPSLKASTDKMWTDLTELVAKVQADF